MGTEKRYLEVSEALINNLLNKKNYKNSQKALFLDRDNTLVKCDPKSYILSLDDIKFLDINIRKLANLSKNSQ